MVAGSVISRSRGIFTLKYPPGEEDLRFRRWMNSASGYLWREPSFPRSLPKGWEFPRVPNHLCFEGNFYQFVWPATSSHLVQSIQHYLHLSSRMQKDLRFRRDSFLPTFFFNKLILLHVRDCIHKNTIIPYNDAGSIWETLPSIIWWVDQPIWASYRYIHGWTPHRYGA